VFTRPAELADDTLRTVLAEHWDVNAVEVTYQPVGFGAHHWRAGTEEGGDRFLSVHDLTAHRNHDTETEDGVLARLTASFEVARALHDGGVECVLAPTPTIDGRALHRLDRRFTLVVHPFLDGRPAGPFGSFASAHDRLAALDLVVAVHQGTGAAVAVAETDDLVVPHAEEIPRAVDELGAVWDSGPYAERARGHLEEHATGVLQLVASYERLADQVRERGDDAVITHGEPHASNVLVVDERFLLIDWDTSLLAVPERDLWHLDPGDGSMLDAYRERTGVTPSPVALDLYRLWWDLTEIGGYLGVLRRPHADTTDVAMAWNGLQEYCDPARRWPDLAR
jgi:spectinomycin phosphotransferase/16S rRNA (guanine(1405)-N(7))-methyltransferase